jgi:flavin reductase (DIM6/NTAB) family NADH-FMN oxidoreductase RutF
VPIKRIKVCQAGLLTSILVASGNSPFAVVGRIKDSAANAQDMGFFVWNLATWNLREAVNNSAMYLEPNVDEFGIAGITKEFSDVFPECPRVQESPVHFDCRYHSTVRLPGSPPMGTVDIIIAEVVGVHIKDEVLTNGMIDVTKTRPIARCGYNQYAVVNETFEMSIPINEDGEGGKEMMSGLEGSMKDNKAMQGK